MNILAKLRNLFRRKPGRFWTVAVELEGTWYQTVVEGTEEEARDAANAFVARHVYKSRKMAFAKYAVMPMIAAPKTEKPS